jgi:hypothetical protein
MDLPCTNLIGDAAGPWRPRCSFWLKELKSMQGNLSCYPR